MKLPDFADLVIFENDDYLVVNKPPFLATLDERVGGAPNMLRLARQQHDDIQAAHRLDRKPWLLMEEESRTTTAQRYPSHDRPSACRAVTVAYSDNSAREIFTGIEFEIDVK